MKRAREARRGDDAEAPRAATRDDARDATTTTDANDVGGAISGRRDGDGDGRRPERMARARREEMEANERERFRGARRRAAARETAQEKRVRLAKAYLERLREEQAAEDTDEDDGDEEGKNLDSHTRLAARLMEDAQRKSGHQRASIADRTTATKGAGEAVAGT